MLLKEKNDILRNFPEAELWTLHPKIQMRIMTDAQKVSMKRSANLVAL